MDTHRNALEGSRLAQLCFGERPAEELYDLTKDPYSLANVIDDGAYSKVHEDLRNRLRRQLGKTSDPRLRNVQPGRQ